MRVVRGVARAQPRLVVDVRLTMNRAEPPLDRSTRAGDARRPRLRRVLAVVAAQIALVLVAFALVEVGLRLYFRWRGTPYDRETLLSEAQRLPGFSRAYLPKSDDAESRSADAGESLSIHPYYAWDPDTGFDAIELVCRSMRTSQRYGGVLVFVVGGSVAGAFANEEAEQSTMSRILAADPVRPCRSTFFNFARGGFKEPQQLNLVVYLLSMGLKPDVVMNVDGFNEVALGCNNHSLGWHPVFPSAAHWSNLLLQGADDAVGLDSIGECRDAQRALERWCERIGRWSLDRTCVTGTLARMRMLRLRANLVARADEYGRHLIARRGAIHEHGPPLEPSEDAAIDASVRVWKETSRCLNDLCRERGILYMHVLQPTLHDTDSKPLTQTELDHARMSDAWLRGVKAGYPKLRAAGEELRRSGVSFVDASMIFRDRNDDIYTDACHFGRDGNFVLASLVGGELAQRLREKPR